MVLSAFTEVEEAENLDSGVISRSGEGVLGIQPSIPRVPRKSNIRPRSSGYCGSTHALTGITDSSGEVVQVVRRSD